MDRAQFMEQLKKLLSDVSEAERLEALDYYNSYFDDAGEENEAAVIRELGSPGKVAAIIKADLQESNDRYAEYTEWGYEDTRTREPGQMPDKYTAVAPTDQGDVFNKKSGEEKTKEASDKDTQDKGSKEPENTQEETPGKKGEKTGKDDGSSGSGPDSSNSEKVKEGRKFGRDRGPRTEERAQRARRRAEKGGYHPEERNSRRMVLIGILLIFALPLIISVIGGGIGLLLTIVFLPFVLAFAIACGAAALLISGIVAGVTGLIVCFGHPAEGILTMGIGCILLAAAFLFIVLLVWFAGTVLPKLLRKFTEWCHNILNKNK